MKAILTYHSIDETGSPISVGREAFLRHVDWFTSGHVRVVPLERIGEEDPSEDVVALTFDDALGSFGEVAWPLLRENGLPATVFVVSDHVGGTNTWGLAPDPGIPEFQIMNWDDLGRIAEEGATLGAHSRTHPKLGILDEQGLIDEVVGSGDEIAGRTGVTVSSFAYPYGNWDARCARLVRDRYDLAVTTALRHVTDRDQLHRLPRLDAWYLKAPGRIESWKSPSFRWYLRWRAAGRGVRSLFRS